MPRVYPAQTVVIIGLFPKKPQFKPILSRVFFKTGRVVPETPDKLKFFKNGCFFPFKINGLQGGFLRIFERGIFEAGG